MDIAARIESFAEPKGVFISESTYLAMNKSEIKAVDLGPQQFKNVLQEIRVYRILGDRESALGPAAGRAGRFSNRKRLVIGLIMAALIVVLLANVFSRGKSGGEEGKVASSTGSGEKPEIRPEVRISPEYSDEAWKKVPDIKKLYKLLHEKEFERVIKIIQKQVKDDPQRLLALSPILVKAYEESGQLQEAEDCLRKLIAKYPDKPWLYGYLATLYEKEMKYDKAIAVLKVYRNKVKFPKFKKAAQKKIAELEKLR